MSGEALEGLSAAFHIPAEGSWNYAEVDLVFEQT